VIPVEECTLDVLGPLLDLNEIPDAKLVDETLQMIGVLMRVAANEAITKATDEEIEAAEAIIDEILACSGDPARQFEAVRKLAEFYITVADHLVLRLMANGLRTSFLERMDGLDPMHQLDSETIERPIRRIRKALTERNAEELGAAMIDLNRMFRTGARLALQEAGPDRPTEHS
jgi:DNA-binding FadR family transcriptional regulator